MSKPDQAAHLLGKLLKYMGDERICWGTDALWYGSPQDQIQAFRSFQISPEFQIKYGYPALTGEMRANILGRNAARIHGMDIEQLMKAKTADPVSRFKKKYRDNHNPSFKTYGPKTNKAFADLLQKGGGLPG